MQVQFQKNIDGRYTMRCLRENGTSTYQSSTEYFVKHDLLHIAVEAVLNTKDAFFGLIAQGWDIDWFEVPAPGEKEKRPVTSEAMFVEQIVGIIQLTWYREISITQLKAMIMAIDWDPVALASLSESVLIQVDTIFRNLLEDWEKLTPGSNMEVSFGPNGFELPTSSMVLLTHKE